MMDRYWAAILCLLLIIGVSGCTTSIPSINDINPNSTSTPSHNTSTPTVPIVNNSKPAETHQPIEEKFSCEATLGGEVINGMCYSGSVCNTELRNGNFAVKIYMETRNYKVGEKANLTLEIENLKNEEQSIMVGKYSIYSGESALRLIRLDSYGASYGKTLPPGQTDWSAFIMTNSKPSQTLAPREKRNYTIKLTANNPSSVDQPFSVEIMYDTGKKDENGTAILGTREWKACGVVIYSDGGVECGGNTYDLPPSKFGSGQCIDGVYYPDFACKPLTYTSGAFCNGIRYVQTDAINMLKGSQELVFVPVKIEGMPEITNLNSVASASTARINQWFDKISSKLFGKNIVDFTYSVAAPFEVASGDVPRISNYENYVRSTQGDSKVVIFVVPDSYAQDSSKGWWMPTGETISIEGEKGMVIVGDTDATITDTNVKLLHELLHAYNATDIYKFSSTMWRVCPDAVMAGINRNPDMLTHMLDEDLCLSAYEIGWTDMNKDGIPDVEKNPFKQ